MIASARKISVESFDYELPDERIARHPVERRDSAKQLHFRPDTGEISVHSFADLAANLPAGTLLVGNNTRVIHARLFFSPGEGKRPIEIFCLDPVKPVDHAQNLGALTQVEWKVLIGGNRRWKRGALTLDVPLKTGNATLTVERLGRDGATFNVAFSWTSDQENTTFGELLEAAGTLPLPPYLCRETEAADEERYQTVFAQIEGSVAAPTAGLHFTPAVMESLKSKGIEWREILLHVGAGTFRPVSTPTLGEHDMHRETFSVNRKLIAKLVEQYRSRNKVVSVGTTTLRCLESLHCLGAELLLGSRQDTDRKFTVNQWAFEDAKVRELPPLETFSALLQMMERQKLAAINGYTEILLSPVSGARTIDGLITNFHQPKSTLLLLIAAIIGDQWREVYQYALDNDFRFLSYGDRSLLWR